MAGQAVEERRLVGLGSFCIPVDVIRVGGGLEIVGQGQPVEGARVEGIVRGNVLEDFAGLLDLSVAKEGTGAQPGSVAEWWLIGEVLLGEVEQGEVLCGRGRQVGVDGGGGDRAGVVRGGSRREGLEACLEGNGKDLGGAWVVGERLEEAAGGMEGVRPAGIVPGGQGSEVVEVGGELERGVGLEDLSAFTGQAGGVGVVTAGEGVSGGQQGGKG